MPKMLKNNLPEREAVNAVNRCLETVPFLRIRDWEAESGPGRPDLRVRLALPKGERTLVAEIKKSGQPRHAREAVAQLRNYVSCFKNAYGILIAPYISDRSAVICAEAGIGYVDFAGNCLLSFDQVYVQRTGANTTHAEKRALRSLYSPKATRVLRVWLNDAVRPWRVQELAREAEVSLGQASNVKKLLEEREWVESTDEGFRLTDPEALLVDWSANQAYRRDTLRPCYTLDSSSDAEARVARACARRKLGFALTGFSAAHRLAPMVRTTRVSAYVADASEALLKETGLKAVESGANVTLLEPGDEGVFYGSQTMDGIAIVSAVQVYLDLNRMGGRGDEGAAAILDEVLRTQW